jgi:hypothetical protein
MKHTLLRLGWITWLGLFLGCGAFGQISGSITSNQCVSVDVSQTGSTVGIQVTGTWSGTLQPQITIQGNAPVNTVVTPVGSTTTQSTITANGGFTAAVAGASTFQVCGNTVGSGTATVFLNRSQAAVKNGSGASVASSTTIFGSVNATAYGVKADGHIGVGPSFTLSSNVVTCPTCNFTGTDAQGRPMAVVGQIVFGSSATSDVSAINSSLPTPECLIQSIDSATQIHMGTVGSIGTACNATSNLSGSGFLIWGDLDSATSSQTPSTANDALLNAWTTAINNCQALALPSGVMLVERGEFLTASPIGCGQDNAHQFVRAGYTIYGQGPAATILVPTPNFVTADCGSSTGCLFGVKGDINIRDLQVNGMGNSQCGAGFNGKVLIQISGDATSGGPNFSLRNVIFQGWCASQAGSVGLSLGSGAATLSGGVISDSIFETLGATEVQVNDSTSAPGAMFQITNSQITGCGNTAGGGLGAGSKAGCLFVNSNNVWSSSHSYYGFMGPVANAHMIWCDTGTTCSFFGDYINYQTHTGDAEIVVSGATLTLTDTGVQNPTTGGFGIVANGGTTNTINLRGAATKVTTTTAANALSCAATSVCNYYDTPGVTVSGGTIGGTFNQFSSGYVMNGTGCATGNFALTSGWGTSTVASASGTSQYCHMTITGAAGAAGPVLTWTFPHAFIVAPTSCQLTGAGTDASLTTVRLTSLSATAAGFTFTGTPTAVTYTFDISCGP